LKKFIVPVRKPKCLTIIENTTKKRNSTQLLASKGKMRKRMLLIENDLNINPVLMFEALEAEMNIQDALQVRREVGGAGDLALGHLGEEIHILDRPLPRHSSA